MGADEEVPSAPHAGGAPSVPPPGEAVDAEAEVPSAPHPGSGMPSAEAAAAYEGPLAPGAPGAPAAEPEPEPEPEPRPAKKSSRSAKKS